MFKNNNKINQKNLTLVPSDLVEESDKKDAMLNFWRISLANEEGRPAGEREVQPDMSAGMREMRAGGDNAGKDGCTDGRERE
jgi:hypothetical protein